MEICKFYLKMDFERVGLMHISGTIVVVNRKQKTNNETKQKKKDLQQ